MENATVKIEGMTCMGCVASVKRVLGGLDGIDHAEVTLKPAQAAVTYDPARIGLDAIKTAIADAGYEVA